MNAVAPQKSNLLVRVARGFYRGLDSTRRFVLNALFVLILLLMFGALGSSVPKLEPKTALVIAPRGSIVEQYSVDPFERAMHKFFGEPEREVQVRDMLAAIDAAKSDPNIDRIVVVPDRLESAGIATLREIGSALKTFRASGKEVIAYGDGFDQRGYYLAAFADKVYLNPNPEGGVLLTGLGRYHTYFKDAFDKLGIEARLFRVGEYKSAGEPYIRSNQSPEAREADQFWMNDVWQRYLADVATERKLDAKKLAQQIDDSVAGVAANDGDLAKMALSEGLVDELKTRDEVRALLIEKGAKDEKEHTFRQIDLDQYANHVAARDVGIGEPQVAVVVAQGEIVPGDQPPGQVGGDSTSKLIRKAREDDKVKALVLRVNSPGGAVFASELVRREVELTKAAGKPVVVSMGDLAASGGYWISMNADEIVANPSTITGSIGIFGLWFNIPKTMEKLGLGRDGTGTTWLAGAFDPTRTYDPRVGQLIQGVIDNGYREFIGKVAAARNKSTQEVDQIARGRVWSGAQAKERGLVDTLGTLDDAIASAAKRAKLGDHYKLRYMEKEMSPFESLVVNASRGSVGALARELGVSAPAALLPNSARSQLESAARVLEQSRAGKPFAVLAHCQCGLD